MGADIDGGDRSTIGKTWYTWHRYLRAEGSDAASRGNWHLFTFPVEAPRQVSEVCDNKGVTAAGRNGLKMFAYHMI